MTSEGSPLVDASTMVRGSFSELLCADRSLLPFLNLLHGHDLISPDNPQDMPIDSKAKIQLLAYIAQNMFGLNLRYKYGLYKNTPYSTALLTDCSLLSNSDASNSKPLSSWENLENFIEFATTHNNTEWLEIASTLLFARMSYSILDKNVVRYVSSIKPGVSKQMIRDVYNTLSQLGHI